MERRLGVVVPTLNEEARLALRLRELLAEAHVAQIVVADGHSEDGTRAAFDQVLREATGDAQRDRLLWVSCARGRARQMNAGAAALTPSLPLLLFLHADVRLPAGFCDAIFEAMRDPRAVAGAFRTWTVHDDPSRPAPWWSPLLHLADLRSRYSGLPYGDQAIFVRAAVFRRLGGFPDQPLMEDLELSRRLRAQGRIVRLAERVQVSGRRFEARPFHFTFLVNVFPALYRLGVSPANLEKLYEAIR